jgi:glycosyltransferase involved in cell wall biosynthesis
MSSPRVSVIVPVFNGERFLSEALGSLRQEQEPKLEIIVVDDGSTDGSIDIVQALAQQDPRIRLIAGEHGGVSAARNIGVRAASGEYITFLDSDDLCPPGRIGRQLRKLTSNPEAAAVVGETLWFEALTADFEPEPGTRHVRLISLHLHSAIFTRSVFDRYGFFDETLAHAEDADFFLRLAEANALVLFESDIASLYRRHDGNMTLNIRGMQKGLLGVLHRSITRRRAAGHHGSLDTLFTRRLSVEASFASAARESTSFGSAGISNPAR